VAIRDNKLNVIRLRSVVSVDMASCVGASSSFRFGHGTRSKSDGADFDSDQLRATAAISQKADQSFLQIYIKYIDYLRSINPEAHHATLEYTDRTKFQECIQAI
jgi:hypothetical protein